MTMRSLAERTEVDLERRHFGLCGRGRVREGEAFR